MKDIREDKTVKSLGEAVKNLAMQREMIMKLGIMNEAEVTAYINEEGEKYAKKYAKMGAMDIVMEALIELAGIEHERREKDD